MDGPPPPFIKLASTKESPPPPAPAPAPPVNAATEAVRTLQQTAASRRANDY